MGNSFPVLANMSLPQGQETRDWSAIF